MRRAARSCRRSARRTLEILLESNKALGAYVVLARSRGRGVRRPAPGGLSGAGLPGRKWPGPSGGAAECLRRLFHPGAAHAPPHDLPVLPQGGRGRGGPGRGPSPAPRLVSASNQRWSRPRACAPLSGAGRMSLIAARRHRPGLSGHARPAWRVLADCSGRDRDDRRPERVRGQVQPAACADRGPAARPGPAGPAGGLRIGYVPQKLQIDTTLPITVRGSWTCRAGCRTRTADAALRQAGWWPAARRPAQMADLSGGQFQRVLLARA